MPTRITVTSSTVTNCH